MIDGGVLGAAGRAADKAFALHVLPNQVSRGTVASRSGAVMAAADGLFVTARGSVGTPPRLTWPTTRCLPSARW